MSFFGRLWSSRGDITTVRLAASHVVKAEVLVDGGVSEQATTYKVSIGHRTMRMHALLFAIVVADTPEEAGELLLKWSKKNGEMHAFIRNGEFILEVINPHLKGVL